MRSVDELLVSGIKNKPSAISHGLRLEPRPRCVQTILLYGGGRPGLDYFENNLCLVASYRCKDFNTESRKK